MSEKSKLKKYASKRKFSDTPEPFSMDTSKKQNSAPIFVIQKHTASHLHWDLRLKIDGVLKSWAVPKEPPATEGIKRLAIQVEDHPLSYAEFEGVIPEGNYGAGTVEIWDRGSISFEKCEKKEILFAFSGKKLNGKYALINMGGKNWLFFKRKT
jgi:DNA ligase D-like protein (predicted 3'-phosphoesterase)